MTMTVSPQDLLPFHEIQDAGKLAALTEAMQAGGWVGAPVVVIAARSQAITGTHRLAAAEAAGIDVPVVDLDDILADYGTSLSEITEAWGDDEYTALVRLDEYLPAAVIDAYGIDIH